MKLDYSDESSFEQDLNAGENLKDKTVAFTVKKFAPESTFGYNLQAGEHLNFISPSHPDAKEGDSVKVKVKDVQRFLNSWLIKYEKL